MFHKNNNNQSAMKRNAGSDKDDHYSGYVEDAVPSQVYHHARKANIPVGDTRVNIFGVQ